MIFHSCYSPLPLPPTPSCRWSHQGRLFSDSFGAWLAGGGGGQVRAGGQIRQVNLILMFPNTDGPWTIALSNLFAQNQKAPAHLFEHLSALGLPAGCNPILPILGQLPSQLPEPCDPPGCHGS